MSLIASIEELEAIYGLPAETATLKVADRITPHYRAFIDASPFAALATSGPEGLDCSPRGDLPGFVRVNGRSHLTIDADVLASFAVDGKSPRTVMIITVEAVYFQCARAIIRSDLWNPARHQDPNNLPSPGQILADMSENRVGGEDYDRAWADRAKQTLW
ncbi:pyridoxamine 5'-phosphate oxidase family protein [Pedosphaera parvula]|uniref:Pyridoxamine 5'-phosphate oxidase-related FMN-binding n=1 Tax=Pedosphaera parvula (strain Ellin514) TaxID=320771 RepID=B9XSV7_PEDPL|nr:pyridoxamine 5'-phosphate oxidase family protein [Pedosphaera parvula]EEF57066.1 pyridoxamine 5'-phosphate oxidase-related FMN-binding [Pedosphaera parvula Ellin514]